MKKILSTLKAINSRVSVVYKDGGCAGTGWIQSIKRNKGFELWECVVGDAFGGAFFFPIDEVKAIRIDAGEPVLIVIENWQTK